MNQKKILTVVIPTYNMEKYLRRCLNSLILPQEQMERLEVLVINDGSKDSSSAIAHEYQDKYPRTFRVIDKENGNYGSCVNRGIDEAKGKYFRILDADDRFFNKHFARFLSELSNTDADMVVTRFCTLNEKKWDITYEGHRESYRYGIIYKSEDFDFNDWRGAYLLHMHDITYKLAVIKEVHLRLQTGISYTDNEYVYYPLQAVKTVLPLDLDLVIYFTGHEGQTTSPEIWKKCHDQRIKVAVRMLDDYISNHRGEGNNEAIKNNQMFVIDRLLVWLYSQTITSAPEDFEEQRMLAIYKEIFEKAPELLTSLRNIRYKRYLPYFTIWERTGKHMTDFPYNILAPLCQFANTNITRAKKLVKLLLGMPISNSRPIHKTK